MTLRVPNPRRLTICTLLFALALVCNYLFTGEWLTRFEDVSQWVWAGEQRLAVIFGAMGVAVSAAFFGRRDDFKTIASDGVGAAPGLRSRHEWLGLLPSAICYGLSTWYYLFEGETGVVRWLWVASVGLLIVPFLRKSRFSDFVSFYFWEYSVLALIVAGAFTLRYVDLTSIPHHVSNDTAIMGLYSRSLLEAGDGRWVGMALQTNHQFSEHQLLALGMRLFGTNHYGLSMLSVIAGTVSVVAMHLLGRVLFNRWVGLIAASFLAIDYVHLHFSRIIFGPITTCFILLGAVFLMHGIKRESRLGFVLGGVGFGLGLLGYYSGRVGVVIVLSLALLWLWQRHRYLRVTSSCWLLVLAGMLFVFGPNLAYSVKQFSEFNGRGNSVILWTPAAWKHSVAKYERGDSVAVVVTEQAKRSFLSPFYYPDSSTICGLTKPMLSSLVAIFFIIGLGYCARRWREIPCGLPLIWGGLAFLLGGVLTIDPPFWPHLNIATPALMLIAAVGAERFVRRFVLDGGRRLRLIMPMLLAVGVCFTGINNWEIYFRFAGKYSTGRGDSMRQIQEITRWVDYRVFLISSSIRWEHEVYQFFTSKVDGHDLSEADLFLQLPVVDKPTAFVVFQDTDYAKCVKLLSDAFPSAVRRSFNVGWKFTIIRVFPPGFVEPAKSPPPDPMIWESVGWRYLFTVLLGILCLGWVTLHREMRENRYRRVAW